MPKLRKIEKIMGVFFWHSHLKDFINLEINWLLHLQKNIWNKTSKLYFGLLYKHYTTLSLLSQKTQVFKNYYSYLPNLACVKNVQLLATKYSKIEYVKNKKNHKRRKWATLYRVKVQEYCVINFKSIRITNLHACKTSR